MSDPKHQKRRSSQYAADKADKLEQHEFERGLQMDKCLETLKQWSGKRQEKAKKIPIQQRSQWAKNVRSIVQRLKESGFGTSDLYNASVDVGFTDSYEDVQGYSKTLSALQKDKTGKQVAAYNKYLEFIELVSNLTGETLEQLALELMEGITLNDEKLGIPDGCFRLARSLQLIVNRVAKEHGLVEKFAELALKRERHLCSGGECVWPVESFLFEVGDYTPKPGKLLEDVEYGSMVEQILLMNPEYRGRTIESVRMLGAEAPFFDYLQGLYAQYVEEPMQRRLASNTYYEPLGSEEKTRRITLAVDGGAAAYLPVHYVGMLVDEIEFIRGRCLVRGVDELSGELKRAFKSEITICEVGAENIMEKILDTEQFAIFLYPNQRGDAVIPVIKNGCDEGKIMLELDADVISWISEYSVVLPKNTARVFPFQTESLASYLESAISSGELEKDWRNTAHYLDQCPLWNASE